MKREIFIIQIFFSVLLITQVLLWLQMRNAQTQWLNVPDAPSISAAPATGLGDKQFAFRYYALMLQNAGDIGGRTQALKNYDFNKLTDWMYLQHQLDPRSDAMPFLAAYYYSAVQDEAAYKIRPLVEYLEMAGNSTQGEKWRWLAQAAFLARYKLHDTDYALKIARKLSDLHKPGLPIWARQMPLLILEQKGEKQLALEMAMRTLESEGDTMAPSEVLFMVDHICSTLLTPAEAFLHPVCQNFLQSGQD